MINPQVSQMASLVDFAYDEIRKKIQIGEYPPGQKLSSQGISDHLGISRTPVVQALNRLVAEGIAESIPRRGIQVMRLSEKKIRDLIEARIMMELYSVKTAIENVPFYPGILENMKRITSSYDNLGDYDYERASETEFDFHYSFILLSGNAELKKMYKANWGIGATYYLYATARIPLSQRIGALNEHEKLLNLLVAQNREGLETALQSHLYDALHVLNLVMDTNPHIFR